MVCYLYYLLTGHTQWCFLLFVSRTGMRYLTLNSCVQYRNVIEVERPTEQLKQKYS